MGGMCIYKEAHPSPSVLTPCDYRMLQSLQQSIFQRSKKGDIDPCGRVA